ncbi:unnamed protein product [Symbiodinium microadriaticum]|nr:unnamed protein product [Symbiodinium microadriaticum]
MAMVLGGKHRWNEMLFHDVHHAFPNAVGTLSQRGRFHGWEKVHDAAAEVLHRGLWKPNGDEDALSQKAAVNAHERPVEFEWVGPVSELLASTHLRVLGWRRFMQGGAFEVNVEFQLRTMEADANATVGLTDKIEKLGDPTSSEQQAFASSLGPNLQEAAAADPSAAALTQAAQAVEDNGVQVKYTKKPAVSVSVVVVEVNITSNATDFLSPEVEDEIDTMGLAAAVIGGILAAGFCAFLAGLCFAYRVIGYWEKKKQKELLQDESESNHVANMPGGFDYEDEIGEAETSMPRMPPPSTAPSRMSWDDHDDIADSHEPPEAQRSLGFQDYRISQTEESDIWNPDEMVEAPVIEDEDEDDEEASSCSVPGLLFTSSFITFRAPGRLMANEAMSEGSLARRLPEAPSFSVF